MCDTLVRITDHGVLFAKNSDRDPNEAQVVELYQAADHEPGRIRLTHTDIDQVPHTNAVLISRPWWLWGAEMGANEHGVVIGNEAVFTRRTGTRGADGVLTGMDLLRLALERARDRHEAAEVIVSLLERHGQGGSASHEHPGFRYDNSFLVADRSGAVVVETAGRRWATEEVTGSRSISNALTIPGFAREYADPVRGRVAQARQRRRLTTQAADNSGTVLDLMAALREHGAERPRFRVTNGALGAPCAHAGGLLTSTQTTNSWVADLSTDQHWVTATSAPCTSLFKPLTVGPVPQPEPAGIGNTFNADHLWWRHERVHRTWLADPAPFAALAGERDRIEREWVGGVHPGDAWAQAATWEERAAETATQARTTRGPDERPRLVRALWRQWDRESGVWG